METNPTKQNPTKKQLEKSTQTPPPKPPQLHEKQSKIPQIIHIWPKASPKHANTSYQTKSKIPRLSLIHI